MKYFRDDKGAFSVLFAVILGSGIFIFLMAMVLDGGNIAAERRVLQNVAQSGALALAKECSTSGPNCLNDVIPKNLAIVNSPDQLTTISSIEVCIRGLINGVQGGQSCPLAASEASQCRRAINAKNYVFVKTESLTTDGGFLRSLFGNGGNYKVSGCAVAIWGNPDSARVFAPFGISICQWSPPGSTVPLLEFETNSGSNSAPSELCPRTDLDNTISFQGIQGLAGWSSIDLRSTSLPADRQASESCPDPTTDRPALLQVGDVLGPITQDSASKNYCDDSSLLDKMNAWLGREVNLPVISTPAYTGNNTNYTVQAFVGFKLLGYSIKGSNGGTTPANSDACGNPQGNRNCIYGEFTRTFLLDSGVNNQNGAPNIGIQAIKLI